MKHKLTFSTCEAFTLALYFASSVTLESALSLDFEDLRPFEVLARPDLDSFLDCMLVLVILRFNTTKIVGVFVFYLRF